MDINYSFDFALTPTKEKGLISLHKDMINFYQNINHGGSEVTEVDREKFTLCISEPSVSPW